jgi:hypothetical protein
VISGSKSIQQAAPVSSTSEAARSDKTYNRYGNQDRPNRKHQPVHPRFWCAKAERLPPGLR